MRVWGSSTNSCKKNISALLLMSWKLPFFAAAPSLLKQQRTKYKTHCASNFHHATYCISWVPQLERQRPAPTRRDSRKWRIAQWSHAWLAVAAQACQLEPWPAGAAPWAALTRVSLLYLSQADWLRARAEKQAGPESGAPHLKGPPAELFRRFQS